jgi:hypothetical protein
MFISCEKMFNDYAVSKKLTFTSTPNNVIIRHLNCPDAEYHTTDGKTFTVINTDVNEKYPLTKEELIVLFLSWKWLKEPKNEVGEPKSEEIVEEDKNAVEEPKQETPKFPKKLTIEEFSKFKTSMTFKYAFKNATIIQHKDYFEFYGDGVYSTAQYIINDGQYYIHGTYTCTCEGKVIKIVEYNLSSVISAKYVCLGARVEKIHFRQAKTFIGYTIVNRLEEFIESDDLVTLDRDGTMCYECKNTVGTITCTKKKIILQFADGIKISKKY